VIAGPLVRRQSVAVIECMHQKYSTLALPVYGLNKKVAI